MPLSTINKTVALFLVGYLGLGVALVIWRDEILAFRQVHRDLFDSAGSLTLGIFSLALAALVGAVIDGLADVTIRRFIRWGAKRRGIARFFGQTEVYRSVETWRRYFDEQLGQADEGLFVKVAGDEPLYRLHLATGLVHAHAPPHHTEWVFAHFSTHYLASNLAFLVLAATPAVVLTMVNAANAVTWTTSAALALILSAYGLLSLSLHRCLYTYQSEYRFGAIWLAEVRAAKVGGRTA